MTPFVVLGLDVSPVHVSVTTPEEAERLRFRGSPTVPVNGVDPFADAEAPVGLSCRVFQTPDGPRGAPTSRPTPRSLWQAAVAAPMPEDERDSRRAFEEPAFCLTAVASVSAVDGRVHVVKTEVRKAAREALLEVADEHALVRVSRTLGGTRRLTGFCTAVGQVWVALSFASERSEVTVVVASETDCYEGVRYGIVQLVEGHG